MRVTSTMLTNNSVMNMQKTKENYLKYLQEYNTQKKISAPSDDPVVAVRSLKYRTNISELEQYVEKNIPDAYSWMDITESALKQVNGMLTNMYNYSVQASSDSYNLDDRKTIIDSLKQYKEFIYTQQLNQDYAGRYVFAGYRTDTQMIFAEKQSNQTYSITNKMQASDITNAKYVYGGAEKTDGASAADYANMAPLLKECHVLTLPYSNLDSTNDVSNINSKSDYVKISYKDEDGNLQTITAKTVSISNQGGLKNSAYNMDDNGVGANGAVFIPETGEIVFGNSLYDDVRTAGDYTVNFNKTDFKVNDVRPEHYFDCSVYDAGTKNTTIYSNPEGQKINYQINFSQTLSVNTLGCESVNLGIGRMIDDIASASDDLDSTKAKIAATDKLISETAVDAVDVNGNNLVDSYKKLKEELETEFTLKTTIMQETFGSSLTGIQKYQKEINTSLSDLGARYSRLKLTESKLDDLKVSYQDLLSENEDVDIGEAYIKYTEADLLYQASLSATSKLLGNSLLDFI